MNLFDFYESPTITDKGKKKNDLQLERICNALF